MSMTSCRRNFLKYSKPPGNFCARLRILWTQRAPRGLMSMIGLPRKRWGASWCLKISQISSQCIEHMQKVDSKDTSRNSTIALIRKLRVLMHHRNPSVRTIRNWGLSKSENKWHDDQEFAAQGETIVHKMAYLNPKCRSLSEFTSFARQIGQHSWWRRRTEQEDSENQRRWFQIRARYSEKLKFNLNVSCNGRHSNFLIKHIRDWIVKSL